LKIDSTKAKFIFVLSLIQIFYFCSPTYAQFNIGAYGGSFNLPGANLKTYGPGITAEYEASEHVVWALSFMYTTLGEPAGQVSYTSPTGGSSYINSQYNYRFLHLSANFYTYLMGNADYKRKVAFYLGGGLALMQTQTTIIYQQNLYPSDKNKSLFEGFDFLIGGDVKLGIMKLFFRGRADIFLKYPIARVDDGTILPLLTNSEIGLLFPLSGQNKWK
jgi:hypothetical protein